MGASVDFVESIQESGFKIENPNASGSCGCGHSFQVEDGEAGGCGHH
jgi:iron-sulfur cluster assembly accessory protein